MLQQLNMLIIKWLLIDQHLLMVEPKTKGNWNLERYQFVDGAKLTKPMGKPFTFGVVILKDEFVAKRIGDLQRAVPTF